MDPITASVTIARPREQVWEYLLDIANHAEFCDHYLTDWRLTREDSYGYGAGARVRIPAMGRFGFGDLTFVRIEPPFRITARGRGGKFNRIQLRLVYELTEDGPDQTTVRSTFETQPKYPSDRLREALAGRRLRGGQRRALTRLRAILEHGEQRGKRALISGGARKPATVHRFSRAGNR